MSSYIKKTSSDFFVPTEHTGKVLAAGLRFLPDALFCFPMDREGNIVDVKAEGCILSEMREMLAAIAPWVREGSYHKWVYRWPTAQAEEKLARQVASMLSSKQKGQEDGLAQKLSQIEGKLGLSLNGEQRQAVLTALGSPITILTGGPGTGKTMTQKALLALYREIHPEGKIVCCAPTGRAARRMEESTGVPASTIHRALKLMAGEDGAYAPPEPLDADLVLVDEVSMMDIYLAGHLFHSLPPGCQLVLVGGRRPAAQRRAWGGAQRAHRLRTHPCGAA